MEVNLPLKIFRKYPLTNPLTNTRKYGILVLQTNERGGYSMIIKNVKMEVTQATYTKFLSEFGGWCYGNYKGLNVRLYRNGEGKHYIELTDYIDRIR